MVAALFIGLFSEITKHGFLRSAKIASGHLTSFCQERRLAKFFVCFWSF